MVLDKNFVFFQIVNYFFESIELFSSLIRFNQFLTYDGTNLQPIAVFSDPSWSVNYVPAVYHSEAGSCYCEVLTTCILPQGFYCQTLDCVSSSSLANQTIPGVMVGCTASESFLFSTLECLYNQSCIQMLIDGRQFDYSELATPAGLDGILALDPNMQSQFLPTTSLRELLLRNLFVEEWITTIDHHKYYEQCQPDICTYTYTHRNQLITIITNLIGFFGGLNVLLRLLVPPLVRLIVWLRHSRDSKCLLDPMIRGRDHSSF